ncbi:18.1 kDa class I heat shock protein-like [Cucurbita pepo subsp. pepo]|uniref:18.1 kDa class I heat shock protein-like n=1 Tax=Cucurbita pepo subsp. pepo TaxID=3664 RepID=UPI000C9D6BC4|nr:18.1 kDa class I heat shock protein-like [Cucurbita pepo subsp. pepo]
MSIRFNNFFPTDRKERYYVEDRPSGGKSPEDWKGRYYVEDRRSFDKFPEEQKERYYIKDRNSYDQFHEKDALAGPFRTSMASNSSAMNAQIDFKETADAHVLRLELPGVKKHEVKLEIEDNGGLCISTEIRAEKEEISDIWRRVERSSGRFYRRVVLPESADVDKVKAEMNNGILIVTVPKHHFKKPIARIVQISGH